MDTVKLNDWMQVIGIFAVVASLIFVGLQLRQADEVATFEALSEANQRMQEMNTQLVDNSEVWIGGCMGEELDEADQMRFAQLFISYTNTVYMTWKQLIISDFFDSDSQFLINSYAANLYRYPGLQDIAISRRVWDDIGRQYSDAHSQLFFEKLEDRIAELAELEPEPLVDAKWCGRL